MLSVVIQDNDEPNVIKLTYDNLYRELKDIEGSEILVEKDWFDAVPKVTNKYVCFVESDCLVNSGYFSSMMGLFKKNSYFRKLAMLSSSVGVNEWGNRFYGYSLGNSYSDGVIPNKMKKSNEVYPVQIGYVPGAIIRVSMLKKTLPGLELNNTWVNDLVFLSSQLSLAFWRQGDGNRVHINPNTTYVTTEFYVNDISKFDPNAENKLVDMFRKEAIS